jgi:E3 SUMO-protein ligase PIAS1/E3 SUMO-protein ligase PIAS2
MNEKKSTWKCPVCDQPALYENLLIDGYFLEVINSPKLSSDENEILLHKDGSWSGFSKKADVKVETQTKLDDILEISSDDEGMKARGLF